MTAKQPESTTTKKTTSLSEEHVRLFLKTHPDFLKNNPDIVSEATSPERELGDGIVDLQHYLVKNLQKDSKALKSRYDVLVDFCRDNMAVQTQVHRAVLGLIRTHSLEQLLEMLTVDLMNLFNVDIVRLAMESDSALFLDSGHHQGPLASIVFIETGTAEAAFGRKKMVLLANECESNPPPGFARIFSDCAGLVESCALLKIELESVDKNVILAFGVRDKERFQPGQGVELLHFLAQIVAHQLDIYLNDLAI